MKPAVKSKKFVYKGRDIKSIKARAAGGASFDNFIDNRVRRFKVENGTNNVRIMPPPPGIDEDVWGDQWGIDIWVHSFIGPDNSNFLCLRKMKKEQCPICEARDELDQEDSDDKEMAQKLKPIRKTLCYVIDRKNEDEGPLFWAMPGTFEKEVQLRSWNKKTGAVIPIDNPDEGFDIAFDRNGQGIKTRYEGIDIERDASPLSESAKTQQSWLDFIEENPLPDILKYHDADYMQAAYMGKKAKKDEDEEEETDDETVDSDDDEDAAPARSKSSKSSKRQKPVEDDDEATEDEDEDDTPKRSGKKSSKPSSDDDDEVEDEVVDDDDADDDPPPSRKSAKKPNNEDDDDGESQEDEDAEEGEEDEDEPPPKKGTSAKARAAIGRIKPRGKK